MLNYEVDRKLLNHRVPPGTALDSFNGRTYLSLVGFQFHQARLFGSLRVPYHSDFDEVNLRFYVRRKERNEERRGVVFIAEIVPKWAVARVARLAYGENYFCFPMKHRLGTDGPNKTVEYAWRPNGAWCRLYAHTSGPLESPQDGSLEQFISEHYWGYTTKRNGHSLEYRVAHAPWNVSTSTTAGFEGDPTSVYGVELGTVLQRRPDSAFIANGSPVAVFAGERIQ